MSGIIFILWFYRLMDWCCKKPWKGKISKKVRKNQRNLNDDSHIDYIFRNDLKEVEMSYYNN
jgi:hypothetical protein